MNNVQILRTLKSNPLDFFEIHVGASCRILHKYDDQAIREKKLNFAGLPISRYLRMHELFRRACELAFVAADWPAGGGTTPADQWSVDGIQF